MPPTRAEADFVRNLVGLGLIGRADAIRWADHLIAEDERVDEWALDLAQADRAGVLELLSILDRAQGAREDRSWQCAFAHLHRAVVAGAVEGADASRLLYGMRSWSPLPEEVEAQLAWLDDAFALRHVDARLDPDADLRAVLAEHLPYAGEFADTARLLGIDAG